MGGFFPDLGTQGEAYRKLARLSDCGTYRYWLSRQWWTNGAKEKDDAWRTVPTFLMLNPSVADAAVDDPTVRRVVGFAKTWGYVRVDVVNLFAQVATDPNELRRAADPVGPENNSQMAVAVVTSDKLIVAWGAGGPRDLVRGRVAYVLRMKAFKGQKLYCLGVTKDGMPRHPLFVKRTATPVPWTPPEGLL